MTEDMAQIGRARNARMAASRGIGAEERQIGGSRP